MAGGDGKAYVSDSFDNLVSKEFLDKMLGVIACPTPEPTPNNLPTPDPCDGVGSCCTCSGGSDVYNIVFNEKSGPNYVFSGLKITQSSSGGFLNGIVIPNSAPSLPVFASPKEDSVTAFVKSLSTDVRGKLMDLLSSMGRKRRRRRSIDARTYGKQTLDQLTKYANGFGCKKFLDILKQDRTSMNQVVDLMKSGKNVTIFCPTDSALQGYDADELKEILLDHIAVHHGHHGIMFNSLNGGKISLTPTGKSDNKVSWKANGIDIVSSLTDGVDHDIMIIDDVITPRDIGVQDFLRGLDDVSIFYSLLKKTPLASLVKSLKVHKVCFTEDICLPVTRSMDQYLQEVIAFKQFTIVAPTDASFEAMTDTDLEELNNNVEKRREFLMKHVFIGELGSANEDTKSIGYSVAPNHSIVTMNKDNQKNVLVDGDNQLFQMVRSHPVNEGFVHIVKQIE